MACVTHQRCLDFAFSTDFALVQTGWMLCSPMKLLWWANTWIGCWQGSWQELCGRGERAAAHGTDGDCSVPSAQTRSALGTTHVTRHNVQKCMLYFDTQSRYMRLGRKFSHKQPLWPQIWSRKLEFLYAESNTTARAYCYSGSSYSDFCWLHHSLKVIFFLEEIPLD